MTGWGGRKVGDLRRAVVEAYGSVCWLCRLPINLALRYPRRGSLSIEHVLPRSYGGSDDIANLRPAHLGCNWSRGNRPPAKVTKRPGESGRVLIRPDTARSDRAARSGPAFFGRPPGSSRPHLPVPPEPPKKTRKRTENDGRR